MYFFARYLNSYFFACHISMVACLVFVGVCFAVSVFLVKLMTKPFMHSPRKDVEFVNFINFLATYMDPGRV